MISALNAGLRTCNNTNKGGKWLGPISSIQFEFYFPDWILIDLWEGLLWDQLSRPFGITCRPPRLGISSWSALSRFNLHQSSHQWMYWEPPRNPSTRPSASVPSISFRLSGPTSCSLPAILNMITRDTEYPAFWLPSKSRVCDLFLHRYSLRLCNPIKDSTDWNSKG